MTLATARKRARCGPRSRTPDADRPIRPGIRLRKTPRGRPALQHRDRDLSTLARRLLILVDGRQTRARIAADLALDVHTADFEAAVGELPDRQYAWQSDGRDQAPGGDADGWHAVRSIHHRVARPDLR